MFRVGFGFCLAGLLAVTIPEAGAHDRDRDGGSGGSWFGFRGVNKRVNLARPDPAPDADAEGHLHLFESRGRSAIFVHVKNLDPGATYEVKIQKGAENGTLGNITIISDDPQARPARCFKSSLSGA